MKTDLRILLGVLFWMLCSQGVMAEEWRGIVPLKSTRADVERVIGKPGEFDRHQFPEERVSIHYSDGPCEGLYQLLTIGNCKCLVAKDTVMSVYVVPEVRRSFSALKIDASRFVRRPTSLGAPMYTYSNLAKGIVYTVDESDDDIIDIQYLPSSEDCEKIVLSDAGKRRNSWRGLTPLHSDKSDVERLLGMPKAKGTAYEHYETDHERISIKYSREACQQEASGSWNIPNDTVLELIITPKFSFLATHLNFDRAKYRVVNVQSPGGPKLPKVVNYENDADGVVISLQLTENTEEVVRITYLPSQRDRNLRCGSRAKISQ